MAISCRSAGLEVKPVKVWCGSVKTICACFEDKTVIGSDVDSLGFQFFSNGNAGDYYVWFNLTDGASTDPALGATGIQVDILSTDGPFAIAAALQAAVDAEADFCAVIAPFDKACVAIKVIGYEDTQDPVDGTGGVMTVMTESEGFLQDLGFTDASAIEPSLNPEFTDITCHQLGSTVADRVLKGYAPSVQITFKSCRKDILDKLVSGGLGGKCEIGGVESGQGFGTGQIGTSTQIKGTRLILHPTTNADTDFSEDYTFLLTVPVIDSYSFSPEDPASITATFQALPDLLWKCAETNIVHIGDHTVG